jgi:ribonuclease J
MDKKLKVITLGGVEEVGINSTIIENDRDIIVIDFGLGFPDDNLFGIDLLIPNFDYLKANKDKIRGFIITHGHLDHIGGLPYVMEELGFPPIYGAKMTIEIIKEKMSEKTFSLKNKINIIEFSKDDSFNLGKFKISFFGVNHNIPDSVGIIVGTEFGNIVHTGDFKFDNTPFQEPVTEYAKIVKVGEEGVLLAMSDSTNATKTGMSVSESGITPVLENIFIKAQGRIVAATFSSLLTRVNQLITLAQKYNRKVSISGISMETTVKIAKNLGYLKVPESIFIKPEEVSKYKDSDVLIVTTGAQGEENAGLMKMITGEHQYINITNTDTVVLSSSVIPSNAILVQKLLDTIISTGAHVIHQSIMDVHAGGHAHQEDHKLFLNLVKPQFFMPIEGYQSFLAAHIQTAKTVGIKNSQILMPKNGLVYEYFPGRGFVRGERIKHVPVRISNNVMWDFGNKILKEREQLSEYGLVLIVLNSNSKFKLKKDPYILSRGFTMSNKNMKMLSYMENFIKNTFAEKIEDRMKDSAEVKTFIIGQVEQEFLGKFKQEPIVLVVLSNDK